MSIFLKTNTWSDVRAKRRFDEHAVAEHVARMESEERAYRLRGSPGGSGHHSRRTRRTHAPKTQPTISALESGDLDRSGLATLKSDIEALGGTVEITASFGNRKVVLSTQRS